MNSLQFTLVMLAVVAMKVALALLFLNYLATEPKATPLSGGCAGEPTIQSLRGCLRRLRQQEAIKEEAYAAHLRRLLAVQAALEHGQRMRAQQALEQFICALREQAGEQMEAKQAQHLVQHAQVVAQALHQSQQLLTTEALEGSN